MKLTDRENIAVSNWYSGRLKRGSPLEREARNALARERRALAQAAPDEWTSRILLLEADLYESRGDVPTYLDVRRRSPGAPTKADAYEVAMYVWRAIRAGTPMQNAEADAAAIFKVTTRTVRTYFRRWAPTLDILARGSSNDPGALNAQAPRPDIRSDDEFEVTMRGYWMRKHLLARSSDAVKASLGTELNWSFKKSRNTTSKRGSILVIHRTVCR